MTQSTDTQTKSLYERLGGAEQIASISSAIVERHIANPLINQHFQNIEDVDQFKKHVADFFSMGSGGPANYQGRDMPGAHKDMNLNEKDLIAATDDVLAVLDDHGIDPVSRNEVLAILYSLKDEVMFK